MPSPISRSQWVRQLDSISSVQRRSSYCKRRRKGAHLAGSAHLGRYGKFQDVTANRLPSRSSQNKLKCNRVMKKRGILYYSSWMNCGDFSVFENSRIGNPPYVLHLGLFWNLSGYLATAKTGKTGKTGNQPGNWMTPEKKKTANSREIEWPGK